MVCKDESVKEEQSEPIGVVVDLLLRTDVTELRARAIGRWPSKFKQS